ncbi:bacillithiol biosynthesis deacetylase BshB2 [Cohnella sp. GCM10020058]|uniref:bacillithiol biosynthesis deacetylase BshB2 n=1 Tax=Cohnella sp. GCM10020058 TaxID=3317330 RepID=UPI003634E5AF
MEQRILVVLPHPDDECFGISGTLAKHIAAGAQVTYACLTLGERARNMGNPPFANRITLPQIRKGELEQSCKAIGIQDLRLLGFHDKTLEFEDQDLLDLKIGELLAELNPTLVITFFPGFAVHPDHDATGAAVVRTIGKLQPSARPPVHCLAFSHNHQESIGAPDVLVGVSEFLQQKIASVLSHRSQFYVPQLFEKNPHKNREVQERFGTERFYTYKFA